MKNVTNQGVAQAATVQGPATIDQVAAERQRLKELDAIAPLYPAELVKAAKYGDNPCTAQELAYRAAVMAVTKEIRLGESFLAAMQADSKAAESVSAAPAPAGNEPDKDSPQAAAMAAKADVAAFQKMKEVR